MKRTVLLGALFLVVSVLVMGSAQKDKRTKTADHDIRGRLVGTLTFVELPFNNNFPFPYNVATLGIVSGQLKGLGNSNVFTFHHPVPPPSIINAKDGRFFILAADGDKIQGTYEGTTGPGTKPNQLVGKADWVITGGTGRFANASGIIHSTVLVTILGFDVFEWPATWVLEGTINY